MKITARYVRALLSYDKETGLFIWKFQVSNRVKAGDLAGWKDEKGYTRIRISQKDYQAARIAWLYMTGKWPRDQIDHINGLRSDNRFKNLRQATPQINAENQRKPHRGNILGALGVRPHGRKFRASIRHHGRVIYIGLFNTLDEAKAAYIETKRELHEGCTI